MSRRTILTLVLALSAFGLTTGLTASLSVTTDQLGAGVSTVTSCDPAIDVSYGVTSSGANSVVAEVRLGGVDAACDGEQATVVLFDGLGNVLDTQAATIALAGGTTATVDMAVDTAALAATSSVGQVAVTITG